MSSGVDKERTKALLQLLEQTLPIGALRVMHETETIDDPEPFADVAPEAAVEVARRIFEAMLSQGVAPGEACTRLRLMPPFDALDGFWQK
jgi:hypothetical protein